MEDLQVFSNLEFGSVRTMTIDDEPYFVGKDVAQALGYTNPRKAMIDHVDVDDKRDGVTIRDSIGREQHPILINESGLYSLILSSKLESAKKFKRWITKEVIPSIRQNGGYIANQETMSNEELIAKALVVANKTIEAREKRIAEMIPKEVFSDAVSSSKTSILIADLAKIIKQNGYDIGQNRLFEWLRANGYLIKGGISKNMPTQKSMDLGLFEIKESVIQQPSGDVRITKTTKVTGKGQIYFVNKFMEMRG